MLDNMPLYQGEMVVTTREKEGKIEKCVYLQDSFITAGLINIDNSNIEPNYIYDKKSIKKILKSGLISREDGMCLLEDLRVAEKNGSLDENKRFSLGLAIRRLLAIKDYTDSQLAEALPALFKSINQQESFAITKALMDRIYHIPALLENAQATYIEGELWIIESNLPNKGKSSGPIGLQHHFRAKDGRDARQYLDDFREWMRSEALKTFCAYWKTACTKGRFQFSAPLTEIMTFGADENRQTPFSVKERKEFWEDTRKLENTKLTLSLPVKHPQRKKEERLVIEHRLIDVGARTQYTDQTSYPNDIMAKVLNPDEFRKQSLIGTAIHNNTLRLHPKDVFLALTLQIRRAQRLDYLVMEYDEDFLLERANQLKTVKSNVRKARAKLNKKMADLTEKGIIAGYHKRGAKYVIKGVSQKKTI